MAAMIDPISLFSLHWQNYLDIFFVAGLLYSLYIWLRGTRAFHILIGLAGLGILYFIASWSGLFLTSWLLQYLLGVTLLLLIVIFQPEIRQLLEKVSLFAMLRQKGGAIPRSVLTEIAEACFYLADQRIGALLVFPRTTPITDAVQDGIRLDSLVTEPLLITIFQKSSPIHDGAVIIENSRVIKAGTYLPLSTREGLDPKYGTRHRAALGISEHGDTLGIVVSEERGIVSLVQNGQIEMMTGVDQLRQHLEEALMPQLRSKTSLREMMLASIASRFNYHELIRQNLAAKFLALGLACFLWFMLIGQQWSETFAIAKLEYQNIPADLDIISDPVREIHVRVRGPRGSIATLAPNQVRIMVDLADVTPGAHTISLTEQNIRLPFGLEATSIEPNELTMKFDRIVTRRFRVDHEFIGALPAGLTLAAVVIKPNPIELQGPERDLDQIERVITSPIDLSQITASQAIRCKVNIIPPLSEDSHIPTPEVTVNLNLTPDKKNSLRQPISEEQRSFRASRLFGMYRYRPWN
jgi:uncharacterized protein (TIGR00159 family)